MGKRLRLAHIIDVDTDGNNVTRDREYKVSTSEYCLENLCASFTTELNPADVETFRAFSLLTRKSRPTFLGTGWLLQMQYTRFSPLRSPHLEDVYDINRESVGLNPVKKQIIDSILNNQQPWDTFSELTDPQYINNLRIAKWEESFYFALFSNIGKLPTMIRQKPFDVFEPRVACGHHPDLYLHLHIDVEFVHFPQQSKNPSICVSFPALELKSNQAFEIVQKLHPIEFFSVDPTEQDAFENIYLEVDPETSREITFDWIRSYLNNFVTDEPLYW